MKKFFLLASVALCFAACSDKTEELENNAVSEITRSTCYDFTTHSWKPCSTRGEKCLFYQEGLTNPALHSTPDHYHCTTYWGGTKENPEVTCEYFYNYFLDIVEAWNHCAKEAPAGVHGGSSYYE